MTLIYHANRAYLYCDPAEDRMPLVDKDDYDDIRLIAREQEDAHIAANLRNTHLQERIRSLEADNAEALRQLEIARERIQHLNAGIYIVHTMRLNWGLSCPCKCHECDILFEGIRDHLPEGSELETASVKPKCSACEDSGWLLDVNRKVPCDVCEAGPAWLHAQTKGDADVHG